VEGSVEAEIKATELLNQQATLKAQMDAAYATKEATKNEFIRVCCMGGVPDQYTCDELDQLMVQQATIYNSLRDQYNTITGQIIQGVETGELTIENPDVEIIDVDTDDDVPIVGDCESTGIEGLYYDSTKQSCVCPEGQTVNYTQMKCVTPTDETTPDSTTDSTTDTTQVTIMGVSVPKAVVYIMIAGAAYLFWKNFIKK
jgi:hypothetical protein